MYKSSQIKVFARLLPLPFSKHSFHKLSRYLHKSISIYIGIFAKYVHSRTKLEKITQEYQNNITKSIQKMIKNWNKILVLWQYHGYRNLELNWEKSFLNSVLKLSLHQTKIWKFYLVNTNQTSYIIATLKFTNESAAMICTLWQIEQEVITTHHWIPTR